MTYMHEHLRLDLSGVKQDEDCLLDCFSDIRDELCTLAGSGVKRIVDLSCRGMGRDYTYLDKMEQETGLNIIISTGFYKEPFFPPAVIESDEKKLAEIFVQDITNACENSNRKAALIGEIGSSQGTITETERKVFCAAARAHNETGVPISTHTTLGTMGFEQVKLLKSYGANLSKLVIGHLDLADKLDLILRVLDEGVFVEFDTIGKLKYLSDEKRVKFIFECCRHGYKDQLLLSMDITRRSHLKVNGGPGYAYLVDSFLPQLRIAGITEEQIDFMLNKNPHKLLGTLSPHEQN